MKYENELKKIIQTINNLSGEWTNFVSNTNEDSYTDDIIYKIIELSKAAELITSIRFSQISEKELNELKDIFFKYKIKKNPADKKTDKNSDRACLSNKQARPHIKVTDISKL